MKTYCFLHEEEVVTSACIVCGKEKLCNMMHELIHNEFELEKRNQELETLLNEAYDRNDHWGESNYHRWSKEFENTVSSALNRNKGD